jgi:hypothetical protein
MKAVHRLVGYDRTTDRIKEQFDVPAEFPAEIKRIAGVADDDPEAAWSYPLSPNQAQAIARIICARIGAQGLEFFVEPFADATAENVAVRA